MNEEVNLNSFKGKVIYLKLWATWCEPCINEFPYYKKLSEIYKNDSSIVFISLSIDENSQTWMKFNNLRKFSGIEWRVSRSSLTRYRVIEIPRVIIIGRDFKIAALYGLPPSNSQSVKFLNELLETDMRK
jgi:thiol-disulfide isomerase/thioredoxin